MHTRSESALFIKCVNTYEELLPAVVVSLVKCNRICKIRRSETNSLYTKQRYLLQFHQLCVITVSTNKMCSSLCFLLPQRDTRDIFTPVQFEVSYHHRETNVQRDSSKNFPLLKPILQQSAGHQNTIINQVQPSAFTCFISQRGNTDQVFSSYKQANRIPISLALI